MRVTGDGYPAWMGEELFSSFFPVSMILRSMLAFGVGAACLAFGPANLLTTLGMILVGGAFLSVVDLLSGGHKVTIWPITYSLLMVALGLYVFFICFLLQSLGLMVITVGAWLFFSGIAQLIYQRRQDDMGLPKVTCQAYAVAGLIAGGLFVLLANFLPAGAMQKTMEAHFTQYLLGAVALCYSLFTLFAGIKIGLKSKSETSE